VSRIFDRERERLFRESAERIEASLPRASASERRALSGLLGFSGVKALKKALRRNRRLKLVRR